MRLALLALLVLCFTGCAGMKLGTGYRFDTKEFFLTLEQPINGYKK
jgi:hypothetical protein